MRRMLATALLVCGAAAAKMTHFYWALLLLVTLSHGPGKLSIDHLLWKRVASAPQLRRNATLA